MSITENIKSLLREIPPGVKMAAAAKTRTPAEVEEAIAAGLNIIGENYVQEGEEARGGVVLPAEWHFIGHLQKNKVKKAVAIFDVIETVDSLEMAREIDKRCEQAGKTMPVFIEINSGRETQKSGVMPEGAEALVRSISELTHIEIKGLMTMGPVSCGQDELRACFRETKQLLDYLGGLKIQGVAMKELSMGMTGSYRAAIEEGATLIRIGSLIFGERC